MVSALIVADENWAIDVNHRIPFASDETERHYMALTHKANLIMGRTTFENGIQYFDGSNNVIVLSHAKTFSSIDDWKIHPVNENGIKKLLLANKRSEDKYVVVGGITAFNKFLKYCQKVYLVKVYREFEGATAHLENLDHDTNWELADSSKLMLHSNIQYRYCTYIRKGGI